MRKPLIHDAASSGLFWLWVSVLVILLDRISKFWVLQNLLFSQPVQVLPIFDLTLMFNRGAAFSFLHSASGWQNVFLGGLAAIVSAVVLVWLSRLSRRNWWSSVALSLVLGGALGNAWDRILYGYVIDFLSFHLGDWHFAVFNIADSAICVGAVMLCLQWIRQPE